MLRLFIALFICLTNRCISPNHDSSVKQFFTIEHTFKGQHKYITLRFPFDAIERRAINMRCTGIEPICHEFKSKELEIRLCHKFVEEDEKYISPSLSISELRRSEVDLLATAKESVQKYYKEVSIFNDLPAEIIKKGPNELSSHGFFQKAGPYQAVYWYHRELTSKEYLSIAFECVGESIDQSDIQNQIKFIIANIKGRPYEDSYEVITN